MMLKNEGRVYWEKRSDLLYYHYMYYMVRTVATNAGSLIDVGSRNCGYLEWLDWIPNRVSLDISKPYASDAVKGIKVDFFDYEPEKNFDIVLCLQVLEHVPEAERFVQKLFSIGDKALISVPYKWSPRSRTPGHVHDPVDEAKLRTWARRDPNYSVVVEEPFRPQQRRLISYYDILEPERAIDMQTRKMRRPTRFF